MQVSETIFQGAVKGLREALGLSQEGLARKLEVSTAAVQLWEGGRAKPGGEALINIVKAK
jgi:DNA-binding transcriptional regulator YiaG